MSRPAEYYRRDIQPRPRCSSLHTRYYRCLQIPREIEFLLLAPVVQQIRFDPLTLLRSTFPPNIGIHEFGFRHTQFFVQLLVGHPLFAERGAFLPWHFV
jgi:hypothetical protein